MADPKVTLEVDLKDKLTTKLARMNKEIAARGGPAMVKLARATRKAELDLKRLGGTAQKTNKIWTRFTKGIAIGNLAAIGAARAFGAVSDGLAQIGEATKVAARIEVLNGVMQFTGQAAGYSKRQLDENAKALQAQGITISESLGLQQRFIQANLDVGLATDIATVAQNAAVIAGVNSSEAALGLTDAIVKQRPILLKQFGIITSLDQIYSKQAETLGKTRDELTATEKRMGFFNEIMAQASTIAGAYDTAMDFAGKRLTSLPRHFEAAQNAVGQHFLPAFNTAITVTEKLLKGITAAFGDPLAAIAKTGAKFDKVSAASLKLADRYDELADKASLTKDEQDELNGILEQFERLSPDVVTAWDNQGTAISVNTTMLRDNIKAQQESIDLDLQQVLRDRGAEYEVMSDRVSGLAATITTLNEPVATAQAGFKRVERGQKEMAVTLVGLKRELDNFVEDTRLSMPRLVEGTDAYAFAVRALGQEFVDLITVTEKADQATEEVGRTAEETADKITRAYESLSRTQEFAFFKPFLKARGDAAKEAATDEEERVKIHNDTLGELESVRFEASLVGLNAHIAAKMEAERAHTEWLKTLQADTKLSEDEFNQARLDSERILQGELSQIQLDAAAETSQMYTERWAATTDTAAEIFGNFAEVAVTNMNDIGEEMTEVFERIGRSIVVNLAQRGVKALSSYIISLATAKAVEKLFGSEQTKTTAATIGQAAATVALTTATAGYTVAAGVATGAMVVEGVGVKVLTSSYIALASAKAAASLGFTTGPSIAAAATTKAALVPMLLTGFDDIANDRSPFRHGKDYGQLFKQGVDSELGSPGFGKTMRNSLQGLEPRGGDGAAVGDIVINIEGSVITENDLVTAVIDALADREQDDGTLNLTGGLTGGRS